MLDFRIDTFITVCKYMNYTKAAQVLHITQPAVSQHIHWIEQDYGIKLFVFQGKKMNLTPDGSRLLSTVTTLKHDDQALRRIFAEEKRGKRKLNFGVTMTISEYVIGELIAEYMQRHQDTEIKLASANTEELLNKLDKGELDFALVEGFFEKNNYDFEIFTREKYIGVCGPNYPASSEESVSLEEALKHCLISRERGSGTREVLERVLSSDGHHIEEFRCILEISSIPAIKTMLEYNLGISFLYEVAVRKELQEGKLVEFRINDFPMYHDFTFIWRKNSIFAESYLEILREISG